MDIKEDARSSAYEVQLYGSHLGAVMEFRAKMGT